MKDHIESGKVFIKDALEWWFRVPEYQRPFVWQTDQVNELLEDVASARQGRPNGEYFLGSIVLQKREIEDEDGGSYTENDLLDGQQRLTTCLLIHGVARDLTQNPTLKETCRKTVFQQENRFDGIPERLRIVYDIREDVREFVSKFLKEEGGTENESELKITLKAKDPSVRNLANAVLEIRRYFKDLSATELEDFLAFFRTNVLLVYVASKHLDDAFRLFTVLNERGLKLRGSDILKTLNLRELKEEKAPESEQRQAAQLWEDLEGELGDDFDVFLAHLRMILVKEKARLSLLQEFEDNVYAPKQFLRETRKFEPAPPLLKKGRETFDFVRRYSEHYRNVFSGNNHGLAGSWEFDNLITLLDSAGLADFWVPPLLHYRDVFGEERMVDFLRKLENKFSGDWISRETPTYRIEAMNAILKRIEDAREQTSSTKAARIQMLFGSTAFDFDKSEFFRQLDNAAIYGRRFTRYVLYKLDMIYGGPSNRLQPPKEISVEHILPQDPADGSQWCRDYMPQEREEWTDRLGNLVLISRRKNSAQGRLDYADKKQRYFERNIESFPNSLRVLNNNELWTPDRLKANHQQVLQKLREYYGQDG